LSGRAEKKARRALRLELRRADARTMPATRPNDTGDERSADDRPPWSPFRHAGTNRLGAALYVNSRYEVTVRPRVLRVAGVPYTVTALGVANVDQSARHDWREFQRVKNELAGEDADAIEFYPAERRRVDPSNWFLLWCFAPGAQVIDAGMNARAVLLGLPEVQRAFEPDDPYGPSWRLVSPPAVDWEAAP